MGMSLSPLAPENFVARNEFGRSVPRNHAHFPTQAESGPPAFHGGIHLFMPPIITGAVPSLSEHAFAHRWRSLPRVRRHRASSPQGSSSSGCCLLMYHYGPVNVRLSFPTPITTILAVDCCSNYCGKTPSMIFLLKTCQLFLIFS